MNRSVLLLPLLLLLAAGPVSARDNFSGTETLKLKAVADAGLSGMLFKKSDERLMSWGLSPRFKLKSIQEMAVIRFETAGLKGREVLKARLFLHREGKDMLRHIRVSTVNQDWEEGLTTEAYGKPSGACFLFADYDSKRAWAWPGSDFADVAMGSGCSLDFWAERRELPDGWISVDLRPELIYALAVGDTDGLAVQEGGSLAYFNNFISSAQASGREPYLEVELGRSLSDVPAKPKARAFPAPELSSPGKGALKIEVAGVANVFCWKLKIDGKPVERWRLPHPGSDGSAVFLLEDLPPSRKLELELRAMSAGGAVSEPLLIRAESSPAFSVPVSLGTLTEPAGAASPVAGGSQFTTWAVPPLVKIAPDTSEAMFDELAGKGDGMSVNSVWDGGKISLFGCRGEFVSCQIVVARSGAEPLKGVKVKPAALSGPAGAVIGLPEIELYRNWYVLNQDLKWQPGYCLPLAAGEAFVIPDARRQGKVMVVGADKNKTRTEVAFPEQKNQTVYVDIYIPRTAVAGRYTGVFRIEAEGGAVATLPVTVEVFGFELPDKLAFWPMLNTYVWPQPQDARNTGSDYYRLAHQHRSVMFYRNFKPKVQGEGKDLRLIWEEYDKAVGPLLSGEAFRDCRRSGVPVEAMGLPFIDSWPTALSARNYNYPEPWPKKGDDNKLLVEHTMKAPTIGDALSESYKDGFSEAQRQFIRHFAEKGWTRTEMQCMFMGKKAHRTKFGVNMWWTTDEPYHLEDWLALQFFCRLWTEGLAGEPDGVRKRWIARADVSRPQWQGRFLEGIVGAVHIGGFANPQKYRLGRMLARKDGFDLRTYGGANISSRSNAEGLVSLVNAWLYGANAALPWLGVGSDQSLDLNDPPGKGYSMVAPGARFGLGPVADIRLKAFRDGEQLIEYLALLAGKYNLTRDQVRAVVFAAASMEGGLLPFADADNADAIRFNLLKDWQITGLRRAVAKLIEEKE